MNEIRGEKKDDRFIISFSGRIDSGNAPDVEKEAIRLMEENPESKVLINAKDLIYISSAGLRVILHIKKEHPELSIYDVNSEVYEILDMTGFTQMMQVEKAYREVSIEGCEEIGRGANGTIYRIDQDNVVKVYNNADALADIQHEREVARLALILGIPTAISYDVVKVGDSYGSVFELLNASSFSKIISTEPEKIDWCVKEYVGLLKLIHGTLVPEGKLPDMKDTVLEWAYIMKDHLPEEIGNKLVDLVEKVPQDNHMIHGDYHTKNVELQNNEVLLIDMDTLSVGNPIFELAFMYNAFIGYSEYNHDIVKEFQGFDFETAQVFWRKVLEEYLGTTDEDKIKEVEDKARIVGYTRLIRRSFRVGGLESEDGRKEIELWTNRLMELVDKTDTLEFETTVQDEGTTNEIVVEADDANLVKVTDFVDAHLDAANCSMAAKMQIYIAVEEIFVNIAHYAYHPEKGNATVRVEVLEDPIMVTITFLDHGIPYDPLKKEDPDITLPAEEREVGGLGILMTKKLMDDVVYEYKDGQNILTLKKKL